MEEAELNEAKTRKTLIDKALDRAGWGPIVSYSDETACLHGSVEEYPTSKGPADYILFDQGKAVACVEGKKVKVAPMNVLQQAKRYARGFPSGSCCLGCFGEFYIPFIYSTNGKVIWFQDLRTKQNLPREVAAFHTPKALSEMLGNDKASAEDWLTSHPVDRAFLWPFQIEAIQAIEQALMKGRRHMLVAMATGTGKTFTIVNLIYRLMKAGLAKRILFLVDRRALAAQAVMAMASFQAEPGLKLDQIYEVYSQKIRKKDLDEDMKFDLLLMPPEYLTNPSRRDAFVYVSTEVIERLRNLWETRLSEVRSSPDQRELADEIGHFGWWFASAKFDDGWAIKQLVEALQVAGRAEPDHLVVERLAAVSKKMPLEAVQCLDYLVKGDEKGWKLHGWLEGAKAILINALDSGGDANDIAEDLIHFIGSRGFLEFRSLLRK